MKLAGAVEPGLRLDAVERPQHVESSTMISPPPKVTPPLPNRLLDDRIAPPAG